MIEIPSDRLEDVNGGSWRNWLYGGMVATSMLTSGAAAGKMHSEDIAPLTMNPAPYSQMIGQR